MAITWDPSDVPAVAADDLAAPMRRLIAEGRGLVLLRGLSAEDTAVVAGSLAQRLGKEPPIELAALVRFKALVDVFASRRLKEILLERGHEAMAPALKVAAALRLNLKWGFNPQKFARALNDLLDADEVAAHIMTRELLHAA